MATAGGHRGPRSDFWGFENKPSKENAKLAFICRVLCVLGGRKIGVILHILIAAFIYQSYPVSTLRCKISCGARGEIGS